MKTPPNAPSATSLPRSPHDEEGARVRKYAITMGIRMACFVLMVVITPYGWYTWVLGTGAVVLPYIAVVLANVGEDAALPTRESPDRALTGSPSSPDADAGRPVIRIAETPRLPSGGESSSTSP